MIKNIVTNFVYKKMQEQGFGKIFNFEGLGSDGRIINKMGIYETSKRAVNYFTEAFAKEIDNKKVQIGTVILGMVITDLLIKSLETGTEKEIAQSKKVFNMLAEEVPVVIKYISRKILQSTKNYDRINFLITKRVVARMFKNMVKKRDFFTE